MTTEFNLNNELINLRLLFMRTISSIWNNETVLSDDHDETSATPEQLFNAVFDKFHKDIDLSELNTLEKLREFNKVLAQIDITKNSEGIAYYAEIIELVKDLRLLRTFIESLSPENLQKFFLFEFGASNDFANFGIQIIKPTARWNYYGDNQWTKPNTEALYISLPTSIMTGESSSDLELESKFEYKKAEILTQYYQNFPSFFGRSRNEKKSLITNQDKNEKESFEIKLETIDDFRFDDSTLEYYNTMNVDRDPSGNNYNLGISEDSFLSFGAVVMKLIAILWENKDLRDKLDYAKRVYTETNIFQDLKVDKILSIHELNYILENADTLAGSQNSSYKKEISAFNEKYDNEVKAIFRQHFDYDCPWVFNIRVLSPESKLFDTSNLNNIFSTNTEILNLTTIEVPHSPERKDTGDVTMALARYNATGPAYPFTCS